jgi:hypothetical protein
MSLTARQVTFSLPYHIVLKFYFSEMLVFEQRFDNFLEEAGWRKDEGVRWKRKEGS